MFLPNYKRFLAVLCSTLVLTSSISSHAFAQQAAVDFEAPVMEHDPAENTGSGSMQLFTAIVADNVELSTVQIFYRYKGETDYISELMDPAVNSSLYEARISTENATSSSIEYYLQAEDQAGNIVLKGYAFAPLERLLPEPTAAPTNTSPDLTESVPETPPDSPVKTKSKTLYYVIGLVSVLALGALASGGSGGSSGGSGASSCDADSGCSLTLIIGQP